MIGDIATGRLAEGSWLPRELDLAERFGVSRGVARETVQALKERGLVEVRHGRGQSVAPASGWNLLDEEVLKGLVVGSDRQGLREQLLECRNLLEPTAARLAAQRHTAEQLADLEGALAALDAARRRPPASRPGPHLEATPFDVADAAFSDLVVACSGNRPMRQLLRPMQVAFALAHETFAGSKRAAILAEHQALLDAVRARDGARAERASRAHLERLAERLETKRRRPATRR